MRRMIDRFWHKICSTKKSTLVLYLVLRGLVLISLVAQIFQHNVTNVVLCLLTLVLFTLPALLRSRLQIELPSALEWAVYLFVFAAEILGEIHNFYGLFPFWDTMLHTINGFICAGIGFSLVDLLNTNSRRVNLSPLYVAVVAFCFSMTVGVLWEFFEFTGDYLLSFDMQKDRIVQRIATVELNPSGENVPVRISDIAETHILTETGEEYVIPGGYLDLGLIDTMKDLAVNLVGAAVFSVFGFLFVVNRDKYRFVGQFIPRVGEEAPQLYRDRPSFTPTEIVPAGKSEKGGAAERSPSEKRLR